MRSSTAAKVVGIYSIVFGALSLLGQLTDLVEQDNSPILSIIIAILFVSFGIVILVRTNNNESAKGFVVTLLVFYMIVAVAGLIILAVPIVGPIIFVVLEAMVITPIIFSFMYFSKFSKEQNEVVHTAQNTSFLLHDKLRELESLLSEGVISQEEYEEKRQAIISKY